MGILTVFFQGVILSFHKQVTRAIRALTQRQLYREEIGGNSGNYLKGTEGDHDGYGLKWLDSQNW